MKKFVDQKFFGCFTWNRLQEFAEKNALFPGRTKIITTFEINKSIWCKIGIYHGVNNIAGNAIYNQTVMHLFLLFVQSTDFQFHSKLIMKRLGV